MSDNVKKFSDEDLRQRLTPLQYHVTQEAGTEQAFTGDTWDLKATGIYQCVVCDADLFLVKRNMNRGRVGRASGNRSLRQRSKLRRSTTLTGWYV